MIGKFFVMSFVAAAAFATAPAYAGGPGGSGGQNGGSLNGLEAQGIDPNGTTATGLPNLADINSATRDGNGTDRAAQPQPRFTIAGAIVPQ